MVVGLVFEPNVIRVRDGDAERLGRCPRGIL